MCPKIRYSMVRKTHFPAKQFEGFGKFPHIGEPKEHFHQRTLKDSAVGTNGLNY